jgi:hypothetical protein
MKPTKTSGSEPDKARFSQEPCPRLLAAQDWRPMLSDHFACLKVRHGVFSLIFPLLNFGLQEAKMLRAMDAWDLALFGQLSKSYDGDSPAFCQLFYGENSGHCKMHSD